MSAADGTIIGTTKLVDHGPDARRWTMVILAEGYRQAELDKFRLDANAFIDQLSRTPPFTAMWCAMNIYRVDIASTESGADDPAACGDGTVGSGAARATFFDTTFCFNNTPRRLLAGDQGLALATAQAQVPEVDSTVIIVNDAQYGGAGGSVAWFSTAPTASLIGIHELGHSAFRLADEYADATDTWTGGPPPEPNVTTDANRATTKWASLIAATTPIPTLANPDCTQPPPSASPVPAGPIGLFEGASRARCGIWRAEHACNMQTLSDPFCRVCQDAIRAVLRPRLPAATGPTVGTQFNGTLAANSTRRWFTYDWPACWNVLWTVAPRTPVTPGPGIRWRVAVERPSRERITYWITITNLTAAPLDFEARYEIVAKD